MSVDWESGKNSAKSPEESVKSGWNSPHQFEMRKIACEYNPEFGSTKYSVFM